MESLKNFDMAFETSTDFCAYLSSFVLWSIWKFI